MKTAIINGRVITPQGVKNGLTVFMEDGRISSVSSEAVPDGYDVIDAAGLYVSPGFIDMHTHGAGGGDFMDGTVEAFLKTARMHAIHGTTLLYPTSVTSSNEDLFGLFDTYDEASRMNVDGTAFGGMHLEGPFFNPAKAGAQDPRFLVNPTPENYNAILERAEGRIARWSAAPELPGIPEFGKVLRDNGILASVAHTDATWEECEEAYFNGFTHITHFFCATSTIVRKNAYRTAGVIEYGYYQDGMTVEIIADGCHLPGSLLKLIVKIKGIDNVALVTDSMRAAGMPEGEYLLGGIKNGQPVIVEEGVAKVMDRSCFAGSVATADRLVRTMVRLAGCIVEEAVRMITVNPARIMGILDRKGTIEAGKDADIVIFDDDINVARTIINGKTVYSI